jgi:hypothetical protein
MIECVPVLDYDRDREHAAHVVDVHGRPECAP